MITVYMHLMLTKSKEKAEHFEKLKITTAKEENPKADTSDLEEEIDQLVYELLWVK